MTLQETWDNCITMWEGIVENLDQDYDGSMEPQVEDLKAYYVEENDLQDLESNCFFCQYDYVLKTAACSACPGRLVDSSFGCGNKEYGYDTNPIAFLAKIKELNAKRLSRLTLDQTWDICLHMWRWIIANYDNHTSVAVLKSMYLHEVVRIIQDVVPAGSCFFCAYNIQNMPGDDGCVSCPGKLVEYDFNCIDRAYNYRREPKKFLAKLEELNKKRLS